VGCIAGATALAYANSFGGPFILDGLASILENPYLRSLWPPWSAFRAPPGANTAGRPLINFTFALNYAVSGLDVWSYHAGNLLIHILAALTLFGLVRRTLSLGPLRARCGRATTALALACGLLWALHPLQTEAVTYVDQRCESLMGLFFLLTVYAAVRGWTSRARRRWHAAAVGACLLGVGCKEPIVAAPVLVLLYDWVFLRRGPRAALRASRGLYVGLAGCVVALAALVAGGATIETGPWGGDFTPLDYARTQPQVIAHYVRLALWPDALCLDCGWAIAPLGEALPWIVVVLAAAGLTLAAAWRRRPAGYAAAWFFVALAPTSSVMPIVDVAFEHRMYVPLAALVVLGVVGGWEAGRRLLRKEARRRLGLLLTLALAAALGVRTHLRNRDYRRATSIWSDTVRQRPGFWRARYNLGFALTNDGQPREALPHLLEAVRLRPDDPTLHNGLGLAFYRLRRLGDATEAFEEALRLDPAHTEAHSNLGLVLLAGGRPAEAIPHFEEALRITPRQAAVHNNLGMAVAEARGLEAALPHFRRAIEIQPGFAEAHANLARALAELGRRSEAIAHYEEALRLRPGLAAARRALERLRKRGE
jgi:tetratricopeptide (TPR) repeat protein